MIKINFDIVFENGHMHSENNINYNIVHVYEHRTCWFIF